MEELGKASNAFSPDSFTTIRPPILSLDWIPTSAETVLSLLCANISLACFSSGKQCRQKPHGQNSPNTYISAGQFSYGGALRPLRA